MCQNRKTVDQLIPRGEHEISVSKTNLYLYFVFLIKILVIRLPFIKKTKNLNVLAIKLLLKTISLKLLCFVTYRTIPVSDFGSVDTKSLFKPKAEKNLTPRLCCSQWVGLLHI